MNEKKKRAKVERGRVAAESTADPTVPSDMPAERIRALVHDLRTHQIELEMQNEELRRAQEELLDSRDRYSALYDHAPVGYVTVGSTGVIVEANLTLAKMLGIERRALVDQPLSRFFVEEDQSSYYRHRASLQESGQVETCLVRMLGGDGGLMWAEIDSVMIPGSDEDEPRSLTVIRDVSRQQRAERQALALEQQLRHTQKLEGLGVLAGGIAHDFNNLLMSISGNAELGAIEVPDDSPAREHFLTISRITRGAAELTSQMLAYAGGGRSQLVPIDAGQLLQDTSTLLEASISKKAELKFQISDNTSLFEGDPAQIRQIILNLITNASEALDDQSGSITLAAYTKYCRRPDLDDIHPDLRAALDESLTEGRYTCIEVADSGSGMKAETLDKVFDPFFTTKFTGRGLGMSAVLGIVRGHAGALKIESTVGGGTTVRVLFPAIEHAPIDREPPPTRGRQSIIQRGMFLLVDDEEQIRMVGESLLQRFGFDVLTAADGREAVDLFREHKDEIVGVLLDLTMPHMDGAEALAEMRATRPDIRVIVASGYAREDVSARFVDSERTVFLHKPFGMASLEDTLVKLFREG